MSGTSVDDTNSLYNNLDAYTLFGVIPETADAPVLNESHVHLMHSPVRHRTYSPNVRFSACGNPTIEPNATAPSNEAYSSPRGLDMPPSTPKDSRFPSCPSRGNDHPILHDLTAAAGHPTQVPGRVHSAVSLPTMASLPATDVLDHAHPLTHDRLFGPTTATTVTASSDGPHPSVEPFRPLSRNPTVPHDALFPFFLCTGFTFFFCPTVCDSTKADHDARSTYLILDF